MLINHAEQQLWRLTAQGLESGLVCSKEAG